MNSERFITASARFLLLAVLLFTSAFFLFRINGDIAVNTDLKDLSPRLTHNKQLQSAINQLSASIENRFILLLASEDSDSLIEAHEELVAGLVAMPQLSVAGAGEALLDNLSAALVPYRFKFLTEEQRQALEKKSDEEIKATATHKLYQLSGAVRVLPIHQDPFGWFGDYLLQALDESGGNESPDGVIERESEDGSITFYKPIVVNISRGALELDTQQQLVKMLAQTELELLRDYPRLEVFHSGVFFYAANAATESKQDIGLISIGSLVGIVALLLFAFSSLWPLILPFLSVGIGVGFAFAVIYTLFGSVHIITIVFGASLIGIVIDYSLHYFYHHASSANQKKNSHRDLHRALFFSLVTSVIGYSALSFSSLPSLRQVALFSCAGLIAAWLSVVVLAPLVARRSIDVNRTRLPALVNAFNRHVYRIGPFSVYLFIALFIGCSTLIIVGLPSSDSPREIFSAPTDLLKEDRVVSSVTSDFEPGSYLVVTGKDSQEIFDSLAKLSARAGKAEDNAPALVTIDQWLPSPEQQRRNYALLGRLYETGGIATEWLNTLNVDPKLIHQLTEEYQLAENKILQPADVFSELDGSLPQLWLTQDGVQYSFALIRKGTDTSSLKTLAADMDNVEFIDTVSMATTALKEQRRSSSIVLIAAYFLIAILLLLRYRTVKALTMLAVPLGATMATLLILFAAGQPFTVFHSMAMFLVLGLGMDYVIFAAEMQKNKEATLTAVFLSAVTSLLSFGLLGLSSLTVVSAFGLTVLIGNTANLIGTILFSWAGSVSSTGDKMVAADD